MRFKSGKGWDDEIKFDFIVRKKQRRKVSSNVIIDYNSCQHDRLKNAGGLS